MQIHSFIHSFLPQRDVHFQNGRDGGRVHAADPKWLKQYGSGNPTPTVEAYADYRRDGPSPGAPHRRHPKLPPATHSDNQHGDDGGPILPPIHDGSGGGGGGGGGSGAGIGRTRSKSPKHKSRKRTSKRGAQKHERRDGAGDDSSSADTLHLPPILPTGQ